MIKLIDIVYENQVTQFKNPLVFLENRNALLLEKKITRISKKQLMDFIEKNFELKPYTSRIPGFGSDAPKEQWVSKIDGSYYTFKGSEEDFKLFIRYGIDSEIQCSTGPGGVCDIGFSTSEQKWYGWSHRAIYGFGIGHEVKKGHSVHKINPGFVCKTLSDCKKVAIDFARSVS